MGVLTSKDIYKSVCGIKFLEICCTRFEKYIYVQFQSDTIVKSWSENFNCTLIALRSLPRQTHKGMIDLKSTLSVIII